MWRLLAASGFAGVLWLGGHAHIKIGNVSVPQLEGWHVAAVVTTFFLSTGGYHSLYLFYKTCRRDFRGLCSLIKIKWLIWTAQRKNYSVPHFFMENVRSNPNKVALIFENQKWTFAELDEYSNRVANALSRSGLEHGDCVALLMENRPEYVATWLGCAKIGIVTALVNYNLRLTPLVHCIKIAQAKALICGAELKEAVTEVRSELLDLKVYVSGSGSEELGVEGAENMDELLKSSQPTPSLHISKVSFNDKLLYIYTSGTTGLPKAAVIKHARYMFFSSAVHFALNLTDNEIIYNSLPLYHSAGGMVGMGQVLIFNNTAVIRRKFSVTQYWAECKKYGCTVAQYVGEICRYLLNSPPKPEDKEHKVKYMYGNGMRPQIWEQFTARFNNPLIAEFYGATESNANIMNFEGKPGACGFLSVIAPSVYPVCLIRVNEKTGEPIRNSSGLCIRCKAGEPGEFVGRIKKNDPIGDFHGYADQKASEKKIIKDVFSKGDTAFVSGDILVMDELGYVYFKDRTGDTFRWRGENVSTTEVEGVVSKVADNRDAVVFGVEVPGAEGKAGMAAIVDPEETVNMDDFIGGIQKFLPNYARPLFIRIVKEIDMTGTFKLKKLDLQKQGYDPQTVKDKLFFLDGKQKKYVPLTLELYEKISNGKAGL